jgi:cystathionine beta-lyase
MKIETLLTTAGRNPAKHEGTVNPPVYNASTIIYPNLTEFKKRGERRYHGISYGTHGTPTSLALARAVSDLEKGHASVVTSTGLSAITISLLALVEQGDHILVTDSVYGPTRSFCDTLLKNFGVETIYYDPRIGKNIVDLLETNTRLVFTESPGSLTFEMQDITAISEAAHRMGTLVIMDNTWATPLFFRPLEYGVDISIQAGTKYLGGHSDLVLGLVTTRDEKLFRRIKDTALGLGDVAAPDVCSLALRGMRTMGLRLNRQFETGLYLATWLEKQSQVKRVLYPALPSNPGNDLWRRLYKGASGLFGVVLQTESEKAVVHMIDGFQYFKIGASWGGYESLVFPVGSSLVRSAVPWNEKGYLVRFHVGLEDPDDLLSDFSQGLKRINKV